MMKSPKMAANAASAATCRSRRWKRVFRQLAGSELGQGRVHTVFALMAARR